MTSDVSVNQSFIDVLKMGEIIIPAYQRAYSWGEKQLEEFIADLKSHQQRTGHGNYYLGHFIFERNNNNALEIIDGQQRITTALLFLSACKRLNQVIVHEVFKYISNFTVTDYDSIAFKELINCGYINNINTASQKRMQIAISGGSDSFKGFDSYIKNNSDKVDDLINIICNSYVSFALYEDKSVAAQIFELHNTRGVNLTETEKVKSYLMKQIFLLSSKPQEDILILQEHFSKIYELEEKANQNWIKGEMTLDNILMYHLRAVDDGNKLSAFNSPNTSSGDNGSLSYVKGKIEKLQSDANKILDYIFKLTREFNNTVEIVTNTIPYLDKKYRLLGDVLMLDKDRSMNFLLRLFRTKNPLDNKILERWERFLFCYEFIYHKGIFYKLDYANRGSFDLILKEINSDSDSKIISDLINDYFVGNKRFAKRKLEENNNSFWSWVVWYYDVDDENDKVYNKKATRNWLLKNAYNSWKLIPYLLYKYEIENCQANIEKIRDNVIKSNRISIDHIVARGSEVAQKITENINGIGNLAIITVSANSSLQNSNVKNHAKAFEKLGLEHTAKQVTKWIDHDDLSLSIETRSHDILDFLCNYFIKPINIWSGSSIYLNYQ